MSLVDDRLAEESGIERWLVKNMGLSDMVLDRHCTTSPNIRLQDITSRLLQKKIMRTGRERIKILSMTSKIIDRSSIILKLVSIAWVTIDTRTNEQVKTLNSQCLFD